MIIWTSSCDAAPAGADACARRSIIMSFGRHHAMVWRQRHNEWLPFTISQAPPEPLEWPESKMAKPEGRNHELGRINRKDDEDLAGARHAFKITEAVSVKDRGADNGWQKVIRKSNAANSGNPLLKR